jgi:hypothetical protein
MTDAGFKVLTFVSQVISSVAWPLTVLGCALILKRHLLALIPLLRTVKYSDVEIRFGQEVAELARATGNASLPLQLSQGKANPWEDLIRMANVRPRSAIRMAWRRVEESTIEAAHRKNIKITDAAQAMPMVIGAILLNQHAIENAQYELLYRLRILVNEAEQAPPDRLTTESAVEFIGLALRLAASINPRET